MQGCWIVDRGWLVASSVVWTCLSTLACGGQQFSSSGSGGNAHAGSNSSAGNKSQGGGNSGGDTSSAGDVGEGGTPDVGGTGGGSAGTASGCNCAPGHYCRDASTDCFDCAELSRLRFQAPVRLDTVSNAAARFPRVGTSATDLLYSVSDQGMRYTTDASTSVGSGVAQTVPFDSGPLLLGDNVTSPVTMGGFNFVFDRMVEQNKRRLYFGIWQGGLTNPQPGPAPYNGNGENDFSMAVAIAPTADGVARGWWMTDRDTNVGLQLVTAPFAVNAPGAPVALQVGAAKCLPEQADLTPWVTPDGKTLLFSHTRIDGNCSTTNQGKDIYTALLQPATGQPTAPAVPVADVNGPSNDVDPSFSADFCDLYFASDRDGGYGLYRAHRR